MSTLFGSRLVSFLLAPRVLTTLAAAIAFVASVLLGPESASAGVGVIGGGR